MKRNLRGGRRGGGSARREEDRHGSVSGLCVWRGENLERESPQPPLLACWVTGHVTSPPGHSDFQQCSAESPGLSQSSPSGGVLHVGVAPKILPYNGSAMKSPRAKPVDQLPPLLRSSDISVTKSPWFALNVSIVTWKVPGRNPSAPDEVDGCHLIAEDP